MLKALQGAHPQRTHEISESWDEGNDELGSADAVQLVTRHSPLVTHHSPLVTHHSPLVTSAASRLRSAHAGRWRRERTAHGAGTGSSDGHDSAESGKTEVGGWVGPEPDTTCHRLPVGLGDLVRARCNHASRRSHATVAESPALGLESTLPCGQQKAPGASRMHAGAMAAYRLSAIGLTLTAPDTRSNPFLRPGP